MYKWKHLSPSAKNAILFTFLGVLVCAAFFLALHAWENRRYHLDVSEEDAYDGSGWEIIYVDGKPYRARRQLETVLLIGLDKFDRGAADTSNYFSNDQQSDFLMLLIVDRGTKRYIPLHLNRDSMAPVPVLGIDGRVIDMVTQQLALSHTYGSGGDDSCRNTVKAVSGYLYGIPIDHYVSFTMDAVSELNDLVGGVTVEILDDFSAVDPSLPQGETIRLMGNQALSYVRARGGMEDSSNLARMERQRQYLHALQTQTLQCLEEDEGFPARALSGLVEYMTSDCTLEHLSALVSDAANYEITNIETIPGEAVKGEEFMEFYPDEQALKDLVVQLFYEPINQG